MDIQKVKEKINQVKVVSFDVFDTLIFRITSSPEIIFDFVGQKAGIENFRDIRIKSQQEISRRLLKAGKAPHANLEEIYDYIAKNNPGHNWKEIKELEINMEKDAVFSNSEMYELYKYAIECGKRVIAVSDMYLSGICIKEMLAKCGYSEIEKVYSSADLKKTKYERTIFKEVTDQEGVNPEEILHIGDNKKADVELAGLSGWNTVWYDSKVCASKHIGQFSGLGNKICSNASFWYELGGDIAGDLYINLYSWLQKMEKKYGCEKICFLARDGYNMYQIYKYMDKENSVYLETSRRALLLAGITKLDEESLSLLPPYALGQTIGEILNYLGIDETKCEYEKAGFKNSQDVISNDELRERMKQFYKVNETIVLDTCQKERESAKLYFEKMGILNTDNVYFDCGWNGSSQYLLKRFYDAIGNRQEAPFLYVGILNTEKSRKQLKNLKYSTFLFGIEKNEKLANHLKKAIVIPELFFGAPDPSVWCYKKGQAVYEEEALNELKKQIVNGIVDYFARVYPFVEKYHINVSSIKMLENMQRLIQHPTKKEAVMIGNIENADGFVKQSNLKKYIAKLDKETIRKYPRIEIYWKEGLLRRPDISISVKIYVMIKETIKTILKSVRR